MAWIARVAQIVAEERFSTRADAVAWLAGTRVDTHGDGYPTPEMLDAEHGDEGPVRVLDEVTMNLYLVDGSN